MEAFENAMERLGKIFAGKKNRVPELVKFTHERKMAGAYTHVIHTRDKILVRATAAALVVTLGMAFAGQYDMFLNRNKREGF
ncbi:hypothetical protein FVE85_4290 [Porphyridium purpureum]|uniref:Uncharacterized protein n=1 Tax=Porphyridium purpureum TaxID=35688 RepID=A0A5J4YSZ3_PORPP|nr:hypothetical protein FVE85_4290 [Porphyridium purpureum]|eukprot:POR8762..scf229_5